MICETKATMEIVIKLTAKEAAWLKGLLQNPIGDFGEESPENAEMRGALFDVLPSFSRLAQFNGHAE